MLIVKLEKPGGLWEYHEFDTTKQVAIHLIKNPDLKLRIIARTDIGELANSVMEWRKKLNKK